MPEKLDRNVILDLQVALAHPVGKERSGLKGDYHFGALSNIPSNKTFFLSVVTVTFTSRS